MLIIPLGWVLDGAQLQEAVRAAGSAMHGLLRSMLLLRLRLDPGGQGTL